MANFMGHLAKLWYLASNISLDVAMKVFISLDMVNASISRLCVKHVTLECGWALCNQLKVLRKKIVVLPGRRWLQC